MRASLLQMSCFVELARLLTRHAQPVRRARAIRYPRALHIPTPFLLLLSIQTPHPAFSCCRYFAEKAAAQAAENGGEGQ